MLHLSCHLLDYLSIHCNPFHTIYFLKCQLDCRTNVIKTTTNSTSSLKPYSAVETSMALSVLSSSASRQYEFTTYLGPLKNCCPKFVHKLVCLKQPKSVQPAQLRPCVRRKFPNYSFSRVSEKFGNRSTEIFR